MPTWILVPLVSVLQVHGHLQIKVINNYHSLKNNKNQITAIGKHGGASFPSQLNWYVFYFYPFILCMCDFIERVDWTQ